jgi:hypothetical protein
MSRPLRSACKVTSSTGRLLTQKPPAALAAVLVLSLPSLGGCGGDDDERIHDAEQVARCITGRSGTLLTDPLNDRPVDFRLRPALHSRARSAPRAGERSILPRPTAFAAFLGADPTFVPPDFDGSGFAPAVFVFFDTPEAAQAHQDDADMRRGNLLIVFHGEAPEVQRNFIDSCL